MGRRKIEIKYIADDRNRSVTFIKRKNGLFKKAHELSILTGAKVTVHVEDLKERHFDYKSANLGGQVAADFDSDEEDDDDLTDDVAGGQQMDEDHQQQKQHQQQVQVQQQQLHQQQQQQQQGRPPPQASQVRPLQIIAAQPARPGHRRTQSSNVSPNASSSKIRPTGHPYPRSPKVPSTPTMTSTSHRPVSLDLNWYGQMNGAPTGIVTPASATPQGAAAAHAHRLSSASTISNMDLAQAMQGSPRMNVQTGGQQFRADQTYYQEPGLAELQEMFAHEAQQQQALPNGQFMQGFLPSQSHGRGVKLEDFEGFEIMEEDAEASMTQASTPALYDYSANPSLTNLHAIPNGMSNAPGLGIVLEAGSDGFNGASSIDQQFQTVSAQQAQQHQLMQQQAHMQGRPMHSAHMQQSYQQFRRSPGYDPSHPHNPQTSFYSNASGAMSTPNLSWFGNSR